MKIRNVIAVTLLVVAAARARADERRFTASAVPRAKLKKPRQGRDHRTTAARSPRIVSSATSARRSSRCAARARSRRARSARRCSTRAAPPTVPQRADRRDPRRAAHARRRSAPRRRRRAPRVGVQRERGLERRRLRHHAAHARHRAVPRRARTSSTRARTSSAARATCARCSTRSTAISTSRWPPTTPAPARWQKYRGVPPYRETRAYVAAVRDVRSAAQRQSTCWR